jgi:hypothetical protein
MNYMSVTNTSMRRINHAPPPTPDLAWFKLNSNILDYRIDNVGKTGTTTTVEQYSIMVNSFAELDSCIRSGDYWTLL